MRKFLFLVLLILISCESELDILTPDFQSVPIIYAVIDPFDSVQSVRIERTFRIKDKEGAQLQDADSLFYDSVQAWLIGMIKDQEIWRVELKKSFLEKDSGSFTGENHHVYSHVGKLPIKITGATVNRPGIPDVDYLGLVVNITDLDKKISTYATVFSPGIVKNDGWLSKSIRLYGNNPALFTLEAGSLSQNWDYVNAEIRFRVQVIEYSDFGAYPKCIEWRTNPGGEYRMNPERFCNRIMMGLELSDSIIVRTLGPIDVEMTLVATTFSSYQYESNFDGMLDYPSTNIQGAYGLYTTKSKGTLTGLSLDGKSLDSLCNGQKWKHLKFRHW
jgi:hypothetical protein